MGGGDNLCGTWDAGAMLASGSADGVVKVFRPALICTLLDLASDIFLYFAVPRLQEQSIHAPTALPRQVWDVASGRLKLSVRAIPPPAEVTRVRSSPLQSRQHSPDSTNTESATGTPQLPYQLCPALTVCIS